MFEKYVLTFDRVYTMTADGLAAKIKYSPELGEDVATNPEEHIDRCVYNPNFRLIPYLDGKISDIDKILLRRIVEYTRLRYFTPFDIDWASAEFPLVTNHHALPILNIKQEELVLKYVTTANGFKNIKRVPFIESEWGMKKVSYLPEVEKMYSNFMGEK